MKGKKILNWVVLLVNILGIISILYFGVPYLTHNTNILNPDAMLPAEAWDSAGMVLTIGLIPLIFVNAIAFSCTKDKKIYFRVLCFAPSFFCLAMVISYWFISLL